MSIAGADFLSRVAASAVGDVAFVAPRLPTLFERDGGPGGEQDELAETVEEIESGWSASSLPTLLSPPAQPGPALPPTVAPGEKSPSRTAAAPTPVVRGESPASPRPAIVAAPSVPSHPPAAEPVAPAMRRPAAALLPPPPTVDWPSAAPPPARAEGRPILSPPLPEPRPHRLAAETETEQRVARPPAPPAPEPAPVLARQRDPAPAALRADRHEPVAKPVDAAPAMVPTAVLQPQSVAAPVIVQAPEIRRRADRRERDPAAAAPHPAPVVNITIGRVDVRVHAAPAAPPRSSRARAEPQSLSDYLGRRKAGQ